MSYEDWQEHWDIFKPKKDPEQLLHEIKTEEDYKEAAQQVLKGKALRNVYVDDLIELIRVIEDTIHNEYEYGEYKRFVDEVEQYSLRIYGGQINQVKLKAREFWSIRIPLRIYAEFVSDVSFDRVTFMEEVYFRNTVFREGVSFQNTVAQKGIIIKQAVFETDAIFRGVELRGAVKFDRVKFKCDLDFSHSMSFDRTAFAECVFEGCVNYSNALMKGVEFFSCNLGQELRFDGSTILNEIFFDKIELSGAICMQELQTNVKKPMLHFRDVTVSESVVIAIDVSLIQIFDEHADKRIFDPEIHSGIRVSYGWPIPSLEEMKRGEEELSRKMYKSGIYSDLILAANWYGIIGENLAKQAGKGSLQKICEERQKDLLNRAQAYNDD